MIIDDSKNIKNVLFRHAADLRFVVLLIGIAVFRFVP